MNIHGNLKFIGGGQLSNLRVENISTDPTTPTAGQLWFNSSSNVMRFFDGTSTLDIADANSLADYLPLAGGTLTGELVLSADPTVALGATTKQYVDNGLSLKQDDLGFVPVNKAGDSLTGNLIFGGTATVTGLSSPANASDAATKQYVDASVAGLDMQADVLNIQVDATLDPGLSPATGDRYIITASLALHSNFGTISGLEDNDIVEYNGTAWVIAYDVSVKGAGALSWVTANTSFYFWDGTTWSQFGGLAGVTAGVGLAKTGNTLDVNLGAGISALPTDEVGIDLATASGLQLTVDGTTDSTDTSAQLQLRLNGSTLTKAAAGLSVAAAGITEVELNASVAGNGLTGGAGTALAVGAGTGVTVAADTVSFDTSFGDSRYLTLSGGTLTGTLVLAADPANALEAATKQYVDAVNTRLTNSHFVYDGTATAAVSHTVTHNIGQQYCNVTVIDASNNSIIPDTITFDTANQLTVTFAAATACRVVVTGLA